MAIILKQVCMIVKGPARSASRTMLPSLARVRTGIPLLRVSRICYAFRGSVTLTPLTVNSAFQPHPSLMTREVSFDAMRLLRLNLVLSSSLRQAREAAAVISSQRVAPIMPNHIYPVASSNQWSSMASFPSATNNSTNHCNWAAEPFPRVLAQPTKSFCDSTLKLLPQLRSTCWLGFEVDTSRFACIKLEFVAIIVRT
jgi:hypothetical protein